MRVVIRRKALPGSSSVGAPRALTRNAGPQALTVQLLLSCTVPQAGHPHSSVGGAVGVLAQGDWREKWAAAGGEGAV